MIIELKEKEKEQFLKEMSKSRVFVFNGCTESDIIAFIPILQRAGIERYIPYVKVLITDSEKSNAIEGCIAVLHERAKGDINFLLDEVPRRIILKLAKKVSKALRLLNLIKDKTSQDKMELKLLGEWEE